MACNLWRSERSVPVQSLQMDIIYQRHGLEKIEPGRHTETDCGGVRSPDFQANRRGEAGFPLDGATLGLMLAAVYRKAVGSLTKQLWESWWMFRVLPEAPSQRAAARRLLQTA